MSQCVVQDYDSNVGGVAGDSMCCTGLRQSNVGGVAGGDPVAAESEVFLLAAAATTAGGPGPEEDGGGRPSPGDARSPGHHPQQVVH